MDGAFIGRTFPHMLFMVQTELQPKRSFVKYVPRIYGFKIHPSAYRDSPEDAKEEQGALGLLACSAAAIPSPMEDS